MTHLKRLNMPKTWNLLRKAHTFTYKPNPGKWLEHSLAVAVVLRDYLSLVTTAKEARRILHDKQVFVNGKVVYDKQYPIGLMDVVSVPSMKKYWRLLISDKNKLYFAEIKEAESKITLARVTGKHTLHKGITQYNTHNGYNVQKSAKYAMGETLTLHVPDLKIEAHYPLEKGVTVLLTASKHAGKVCKVESVDGSVIHLKHKDGDFETTKKNTFVIGKDKPVITL